MASLDVNGAYRVNLPCSSVGALRSWYVPVYTLNSFEFAGQIGMKEISGNGLASTLPVM